MAFIKQKKKMYFYDPNIGVAEFQPANRWPECLHEALLAPHKTFNVPDVRIYRVKKNESPNPFQQLDSVGFEAAIAAPFDQLRIDAI